MTTFKIETCPFCGSMPDVEPWHRGAPSKHLVNCSNDECHAGPSAAGETRTEAIERWNAREGQAERGKAVILTAHRLIRTTAYSFEGTPLTTIGLFMESFGLEVVDGDRFEVTIRRLAKAGHHG